MIKVSYSNDKIIVSGHAGYDNYGKDIVCASVSSIIYTTVNAIKSFNENSIEFTDDDVMTIKILDNNKETNILIDNMIELLKELEQQYPKNIKISKGE